ncbi:MAG: GtrA family protein [Patescibacteria group bacterium]|jgi:putative flippase GtrA
MINKLIQRVNIKQFVRFCIIGTFNTGLDFLVYISLTRNFAFWTEHLLLATASGFIAASTSSYILNRYWTFKVTTGQHRVQYTKFMLVVSGGLGINALCFYVLVHVWHINDLISKALVVGIVLFWNYLLNSRWTFR